MNGIWRLSQNYRGTQQPPFPQTESQHNSFKMCCGNFSQHNKLKLLCCEKLSQHNGSGIQYCKLFMFILGFYL